MVFAANSFTPLTIIFEDGGPTWFNYPGFELWKFLNLFVFTAAMIYLLRKPLADALAARRDGIRRELKKAQEERDKALAELASVEDRLQRLDSEVTTIRAKAKAEAEAEAERIKVATDLEMTKLREQAKREIENAGKVAKQELRKFAAEQSVRLAEEVIQKEIRPEDDARLMKMNLEELGRSRT